MSVQLSKLVPVVPIRFKIFQFEVKFQVNPSLGSEKQLHNLVT